MLILPNLPTKDMFDHTSISLPPFTSLANEIMFLVALVCLFVCLWITLLKKLGTDWDEILWKGPG